ncbi:hypothetical protein SNEBB_004496, partial [Seison nebaliae]
MNRPTTGVAPGTASRLQTAKPGTRAGNITTALMADRPVTRGGLGGLKTAMGPGTGANRLVQDKNYFVNLIRAKTVDAKNEIDRLKKEMVRANEDNTNYMAYNRRAEELTKEVESVRGKKADLNTVVDRLHSNSNISELKSSIEELKRKIDNEEKESTRIISQRTRLDAAVNEMQNEMDELNAKEQHAVDRLSYEDRQKYLTIKEKNSEYTSQLTTMFGEMETIRDEIAGFMGRLDDTPEKKEALNLFDKLNELEQKKDSMKSDAERFSALSPKEEEEKLLAQVKNDKVEISGMDEKIRSVRAELNKHEMEEENDLDDDGTDEKAIRRRYEKLRREEEEMDHFNGEFTNRLQDATGNLNQAQHNVVHLLDILSRVVEKTDRSAADDAKSLMVTTIEGMNDQLQSLQRDLKKMDPMKEKLNDEYNALEGKIKEYEEELGDYTDNETIKRKAEEKRDKLIEEKDLLRKRRDEFVRMINQAEQDLKRLKITYNNHKMTKSIEPLEEQLQELEGKNYSLRQIIANKQLATDYEKYKLSSLEMVEEQQKFLREHAANAPAPAAAGEMILVNGERLTQIVIPLNDDDITEGAEAFTVRLYAKSRKLLHASKYEIIVIIRPSDDAYGIFHLIVDCHQSTTRCEEDERIVNVTNLSHAKMKVRRSRGNYGNVIINWEGKLIRKFEELPSSQSISLQTISGTIEIHHNRWLSDDNIIVPSFADDRPHLEHIWRVSIYPSTTNSPSSTIGRVSRRTTYVRMNSQLYQSFSSRHSSELRYDEILDDDRSFDGYLSDGELFIVVQKSENAYGIFQFSISPSSLKSTNLLDTWYPRSPLMNVFENHSQANVCVERDGGAYGVVDAQLEVTSFDTKNYNYYRYPSYIKIARENIDYQLPDNLVLRFNRHVKVNCLTIQIINDEENELTEIIWFKLSNVQLIQSENSEIIDHVPSINGSSRTIGISLVDDDENKKSNSIQTYLRIDLREDNEKFSCNFYPISYQKLLANLRYINHQTDERNGQFKSMESQINYVNGNEWGSSSEWNIQMNYVNSLNDTYVPLFCIDTRHINSINFTIYRLSQQKKRVSVLILIYPTVVNLNKSENNQSLIDFGIFGIDYSIDSQIVTLNENENEKTFAINLLKETYVNHRIFDIKFNSLNSSNFQFHSNYLLHNTFYKNQIEIIGNSFYRFLLKKNTGTTFKFHFLPSPNGNLKILQLTNNELNFRIIRHGVIEELQSIRWKISTDQSNSEIECQNYFQKIEGISIFLSGEYDHLIQIKTNSELFERLIICKIELISNFVQGDLETLFIILPFQSINEEIFQININRLILNEHNETIELSINDINKFEGKLLVNFKLSSISNSFQTPSFAEEGKDFFNGTFNKIFNTTDRIILEIPIVSDEIPEIDETFVFYVHSIYFIPNFLFYYEQETKFQDILRDYLRMESYDLSDCMIHHKNFKCFPLKYEGNLSFNLTIKENDKSEGSFRLEPRILKNNKLEILNSQDSNRTYYGMENNQKPLQFSVKRLNSFFGKVFIKWNISSVINFTEDIKNDEGMIIFEENQKEKYFSIILKQDNIAEYEEEFILNIFNFYSNQREDYIKIRILANDGIYGNVTFSETDTILSLYEGFNIAIPIIRPIDNKILKSLTVIEIEWEVNSINVTTINMENHFETVSGKVELLSYMNESYIILSAIDDSLPELSRMFHLKLTSYRMKTFNNSIFDKCLNCVNEESYYHLSEPIKLTKLPIRLIIDENDYPYGLFGFDLELLTIEENVDKVSINIHRYHGTYGNVLLNIDICPPNVFNGIIAKEGNDFSFISNNKRIEFKTNERNHSIILTIIDDDEIEDNEFLCLQINYLTIQSLNGTGEKFIDNNRLLIEIQDNDIQRQIVYVKNEYQKLISKEGNDVVVPIHRNFVSVQPIYLSVEISSISTTDEIDYKLRNKFLVFSPDVTEIFLEIKIIKDSKAEWFDHIILVINSTSDNFSLINNTINIFVEPNDFPCGVFTLHSLELNERDYNEIEGEVLIERTVDEWCQLSIDYSFVDNRNKTAHEFFPSNNLINFRIGEKKKKINFIFKNMEFQHYFLRYSVKFIPITIPIPISLSKGFPGISIQDFDYGNWFGYELRELEIPLSSLRKEIYSLSFSPNNEEFISFNGNEAQIEGEARLPLYRHHQSFWINIKLNKPNYISSKLCLILQSELEEIEESDEPQNLLFLPITRMVIKNENQKELSEIYSLKILNNNYLIIHLSGKLNFYKWNNYSFQFTTTIDFNDQVISIKEIGGSNQFLIYSQNHHRYQLNLFGMNNSHWILNDVKSFDCKMVWEVDKIKLNYFIIAFDSCSKQIEWSKLENDKFTTFNLLDKQTDIISIQMINLNDLSFVIFVYSNSNGTEGKMNFDLFEIDYNEKNLNEFLITSTEIDEVTRSDLVQMEQLQFLLLFNEERKILSVYEIDLQNEHIQINFITFFTDIIHFQTFIRNKQFYLFGKLEKYSVLYKYEEKVKKFISLKTFESFKRFLTISIDHKTTVKVTNDFQQSRTNSEMMEISILKNYSLHSGYLFKKNLFLSSEMAELDIPINILPLPIYQSIRIVIKENDSILSNFIKVSSCRNCLMKEGADMSISTRLGNVFNNEMLEDNMVGLDAKDRKIYVSTDFFTRDRMEYIGIPIRIVRWNLNDEKEEIRIRWKLSSISPINLENSIQLKLEGNTEIMRKNEIEKIFIIYLKDLKLDGNHEDYVPFRFLRIIYEYYSTNHKKISADNNQQIILTPLYNPTGVLTLNRNSFVIRRILDETVSKSVNVEVTIYRDQGTKGNIQISYEIFNELEPADRRESFVTMIDNQKIINLKFQLPIDKISNLNEKDIFYRLTLTNVQLISKQSSNEVPPDILRNIYGDEFINIHLLTEIDTIQMSQITFYEQMDIVHDFNDAISFSLRKTGNKKCEIIWMIVGEKSERIFSTTNNSITMREMDKNYHVDNIKILLKNESNIFHINLYSLSPYCQIGKYSMKFRIKHGNYKAGIFSLKYNSNRQVNEGEKVYLSVKRISDFNGRVKVTWKAEPAELVNNLMGSLIFENGIKLVYFNIKTENLKKIDDNRRIRIELIDIRMMDEGSNLIPLIDDVERYVYVPLTNDDGLDDIIYIPYNRRMINYYMENRQLEISIKRGANLLNINPLMVYWQISPALYVINENDGHFIFNSNQSEYSLMINVTSFSKEFLETILQFQLIKTEPKISNVFDKNLQTIPNSRTGTIALKENVSGQLVQFSFSESIIHSSTSSIMVISIERTGNISNSIIVNYENYDVTANEKVDYMLMQSTLTFGRNVKKSFLILKILHFPHQLIQRQLYLLLRLISAYSIETNTPIQIGKLNNHRIWISSLSESSPIPSTTSIYSTTSTTSISSTTSTNNFPSTTSEVIEIEKLWIIQFETRCYDSISIANTDDTTCIYVELAATRNIKLTHPYVHRPISLSVVLSTQAIGDSYAETIQLPDIEFLIRPTSYNKRSYTCIRVGKMSVPITYLHLYPKNFNGYHLGLRICKLNLMTTKLSTSTKPITFPLSTSLFTLSSSTSSIFARATVELLPPFNYVVRYSVASFQFITPQIKLSSSDDSSISVFWRIFSNNQQNNEIVNRLLNSIFPDGIEGIIRLTQLIESFQISINILPSLPHSTYYCFQLQYPYNGNQDISIVPRSNTITIEIINDKIISQENIYRFAIPHPIIEGKYVESNEINEPTTSPMNVTFMIIREDNSWRENFLFWRISCSQSISSFIFPTSGQIIFHPNDIYQNFTFTIIPNDLPQLFTKCSTLLLTSNQHLSSKLLFFIQPNDDPHGIFSISSGYILIANPDVVHYDNLRSVVINFHRSKGVFEDVNVLIELTTNNDKLRMNFLQNTNITFKNNQSDVSTIIDIPNSIILYKSTFIRIFIKKVELSKVENFTQNYIPPKISESNDSLIIFVPNLALNPEISFSKSNFLLESDDTTKTYLKVNITVKREGAFGWSNILWKSSYSLGIPSGVVRLSSSETLKHFTYKLLPSIDTNIKIKIDSEFSHSQFPHIVTVDSTTIEKNGILEIEEDNRLIFVPISNKYETFNIRMRRIFDLIEETGIVIVSSIPNIVRKIELKNFKKNEKTQIVANVNLNPSTNNGIKSFFIQFATTKNQNSARISRIYNQTEIRF